MKNAFTVRFAASAALIVASALASHAQLVSPNAQNRSVIKTDAVRYLFPEQLTLPAGKPSQVALHFRVAEGLHINSHTPSDEYLIPTDFSIPDGSGSKLIAATYPTGSIITL
ncbi:MAG: hypothetical protein WB567_12030, partial [Terracidiphilus sp.]